MRPQLVKLFLLEVILGGAGAVLGSILGNALGRGGLLVGAVIGGVAMVVVAGLLACRMKCVHTSERFWVITGGIAGFVIACLLALATMSSPVGPILSALLIGVGAVLGSVLGRSPHGEP